MVSSHKHRQGQLYLKFRPYMKHKILNKNAPPKFMKRFTKFRFFSNLVDETSRSRT